MVGAAVARYGSVKRWEQERKRNRLPCNDAGHGSGYEHVEAIPIYEHWL